MVTKRGTSPNGLLEEPEDIKMLFDEVARHFEGADDGARGMFSMLVKTTLKYRDDLVAKNEEVLSVGDTREALDAFMKVLQTHKMATDLKPRVQTLLVMWLTKLKAKVHN